MLNPIVYAVPVFLLMMAAEYAVARHRGEGVYRAADTVASVSLGIVSQLVGVFTKLATLGVYTLVYNHAALWRLPAESPWVWVGALLAYDFCYYWAHRAGHEVSVLWAAHVVHHSSEEYNLSTALRQSSTGFLLGWVFYLPMAVLGVPPLVFVVVGLVDLLYQFWVHTRLVGRLGWFDRVFCSPSNHRVHHGQNDYCLDRNYGGLLIVWDRLFGTFAPERPDEPIVYGIRGPLRSWSPLRANGHVYAGLWQDMRLTRRWADKLRVLALRPGWRPADAAAALPKAPYRLADFQRFAPPLPAALAWHALLQLAVLMAFGLHFLAIAPPLHWAPGLACAGLLVAHLALLARLCERGMAARPLEAVRLVAGVLLVALSPWHGLPWLVLAAVAALAGAALMFRRSALQAC